jgi:plastocyanin
MTHARRTAALAATLAAGAAAALLATGAPADAAKSAKGKTRTVGVASDFYEPGKLTIHVGDTVRWKWHASGLSLHDVTVDTGPESFASPTQAAGSFAHRFKKAGTYKLYCTQHEDTMTATVVVKRSR